MHRLDRCSFVRSYVHSFVWWLVFMCNVYALVDISNWTTARRTDRQTDGQTDRQTIWGIYVTSTQRNIPQNSSSDFWLLRLRLSCVRHGGVECWIVGYRGCWATICAFVRLILFGIQISFVFFVQLIIRINVTMWWILWMPEIQCPINAFKCHSNCSHLLWSNANGSD